MCFAVALCLEEACLCSVRSIYFMQPLSLFFFVFYTEASDDASFVHVIPSVCVGAGCAGNAAYILCLTFV